MNDITKNIMFGISMEKFGMNNEAVIAYALKNNIKDYVKFVKIFDSIRSKTLDNLWKLSTNKQLTAIEIETVSKLYCAENAIWLNEDNFKSLLHWLMYMSWHDGLLKD